MDFSFTGTEDGLLYKERRKPLLRGLICIFGILMIAFSYIFIYLIFKMGDINTAAKLGSVVVSIVELVVFVLFGGYCLKLALLAPVQTLFFDKERRQLDFITDAPARRASKKSYPFNDITKIEAVAYAYKYDLATFSITINFSNSDKICIASFDNREQADNYISRINLLLS